MENRDVDPASPHPGVPELPTFAPVQGEPPAAAPIAEHAQAAEDGSEDVSDAQAAAPLEQRPDTVKSDQSAASTEIAVSNPEAAVTLVADEASPSGIAAPLPESPSILPVALPAAEVSDQATITAVAESSSSVPVAILVAENATALDVANPLPELASVLPVAIPVAAVCGEAIVPVGTPVAENAIATEVAGPLTELPTAIPVATPIAAGSGGAIVAAIAVPIAESSHNVPVVIPVAENVVAPDAANPLPELASVLPVALPVAAFGGQPIISAIAVPVPDSPGTVPVATPTVDGSGPAVPSDASAATPIPQPPVPRPFDPWHKWLGVHPSEQPPHYYRLLGLMPLEDDLEVIETAASRQMEYVTQRAAGPHGEFVQPVLNVLSTARACLLAPEQKSAYDSRLKQSPPPAQATEPKPEWQPAPKPDLVLAPPAPAPAFDFGAAAATVGMPLGGSPVVALPSEPRRMKMREQDSPLGVIVAAVFGGICAFALFFLYEKYVARRTAPRRGGNSAATSPMSKFARIVPRLPESRSWCSRNHLGTSTPSCLADAQHELHRCVS